MNKNLKYNKVNSIFFSSTGDCVSYKDNPAFTNCNGRPNCAFYDFGTPLPECSNAQSTYLQVDYDCIPSNILEKLKT